MLASWLLSAVPRSRRRASSSNPSQRFRIARTIVPLLLLLLTTWAFAFTARATQCVDYRDLIRPVGGFRIFDQVWDVATDGAYSYVVRDWGLTVLDVSDPTAPDTLITVPTAAQPFGVDLRGDYAYVAGGYGGLEIFDVSDPAAPFLAGAVATTDVSRDVAVEGDYAYLAVGFASGGLDVIDVSQPTMPARVASVPTPGKANGVAVSGSYAYVVDEIVGLHIFDIANPANPLKSSSLHTPGIAKKVDVTGSLACVADKTSGLQVIDVSNPSAPEIVGSVNSWFPGGPTPVGVRFADVTVHQDRAYVFDDTLTRGMKVIDISDPTAPEVRGSVFTYELPFVRGGVAVEGSLAHVGGLMLVDVTSPDSPAMVGGVGLALNSPPGGPAAIDGDYAYAPAGLLLKVVDISNPASPTVVGSVPTPPVALSVAVSSGYAYVGGILATHMVDITNPRFPVVTGSVSNPGSGEDVAVQGNYAFLADGPEGLQVIDVSNPSSPVIVANVERPGPGVSMFRGVALRGDRAYIAASGGFHDIDIADPLSPVFLSTIEIDSSDDIVLDGDYAYVASRVKGPEAVLNVVDISGPPFLVATIPTLGGQSVSVSGNHAYLGGMFVIDISEPAAPVAVGGGNIFEGFATATEEYVYIASLPGLLVAPRQCEATGVGEPRSSGPVLLALHQNLPNPFNPRTTIRFELPGLSHARLRVYDTLGRAVRTLIDSEMDASIHALEWDGRDDHGRDVASGTYYYELEAGGQRLTKKLQLIR